MKPIRQVVCTVLVQYSSCIIHITHSLYTVHEPEWSLFLQCTVAFVWFNLFCHRFYGVLWWVCLLHFFHHTRFMNFSWVLFWGLCFWRCGLAIVILFVIGCIWIYTWSTVLLYESSIHNCGAATRLNIDHPRQLDLDFCFIVKFVGQLIIGLSPIKWTTWTPEWRQSSLWYKTLSDVNTPVLKTLTHWSTTRVCDSPQPRVGILVWHYSWMIE